MASIRVLTGSLRKRLLALEKRLVSRRKRLVVLVVLIWRLVMMW